MLNLDLPRNTTLYKQTTETYRANSSALFDEYGTNLQNIEKSIRRLYWADSGKILCQVDQSGAEALIVAYECRKGKFRDLFLHGVKPHVFVAMHVFLDKWQTRFKDLDVDSFTKTEIKDLKKKDGWNELDELIKSSDNWKASERYYYIAKQICHASNYGMKANAFQINTLEKSRGKIVLSRPQAEAYLANYHALFPEIHDWHRRVERQVTETGMLFNLQGFPRIFTGIINEYTLKECYAFIPQSTVGCITHIAITNLQNYIEEQGLDWDILGNCHDSYLVQCPVSEQLECAKQMKFFMEQELTSSLGEKFHMRSEAQVGMNWAPRKDYNPEGMVEIKL